MSKKVIDITDKLSFEENPKLKIKNTELEVNSDATTMLQVMQLLNDGDNVSTKEIVAMYELIFGESERKKIDKLKLKFDDFATLVMEAISLVTGESESGE